MLLNKEYLSLDFSLEHTFLISSLNSDKMCEIDWFGLTLSWIMNWIHEDEENNMDFSKILRETIVHKSSTAWILKEGHMYF